MFILNAGTRLAFAATYLERPPDKVLALVAEMDLGAPEGPVLYACQMHPEVVSDEPGRCPKCGMKLLPTAAPGGYACPMHPEVVSDEPGRCPKCGMKLLPAELTASSAGSDEGHGHEHHPEGHHDQHAMDPQDHAHDQLHEHGGDGHHRDAAGIEWKTTWSTSTG